MKNKSKNVLLNNNFLHKSKILFLALFHLLNSCTNTETVKQDLISGEDTKVVSAAEWLQEHGTSDTSVVIELLAHIIDSRVNRSYPYYGDDRPYEARIKALEKITGKKSPFPIEEQPDALVIDFYLEWAVKGGYIPNKNTINVIPPYIECISSSEDFIKNIRNYDKVTWLKKFNWKKKPCGEVLHN